MRKRLWYWGVCRTPKALLQPYTLFRRRQKNRLIVHVTLTSVSHCLERQVECNSSDCPLTTGTKCLLNTDYRHLFMRLQYCLCMCVSECVCLLPLKPSKDLSPNKKTLNEMFTPLQLQNLSDSDITLQDVWDKKTKGRKEVELLKNAICCSACAAKL